MDNDYNNIPPKSHRIPSNDGIDVFKTENCHVQMNNEYNNIPPKSHMNLSSFSNIPNIHYIMVFERNLTSGKK